MKMHRLANFKLCLDVSQNIAWNAIETEENRRGILQKVPQSCKYLLTSSCTNQ
jgi:hypothetical protein